MSDINELMHKGYAFALQGSGDRWTVAECERMFGLRVAAMESNMSEIGILVSSAGNFKITTLGHTKKMRNNAIAWKTRKTATSCLKRVASSSLMVLVRSCWIQTDF